MKRVSVYIDGFNFYYGLFKGQPTRCDNRLKWLNPVLLGRAILRQSGVEGEVTRVHYCTAPALAGVNDDSQASRQQHYLRALSGIPEITTTLGQHTQNPKFVRSLASNGRTPVGPPYKAMVREEKGSDVNLATFLVRDAALGEFDLALVISNDSDLVNAIRIAIEDFHKTIFVVSPHINGPPKNPGRPRVTNRLRDVADRAFVLDHTLLKGCRLPDKCPDRQGKTVACPAKWM